MRVGVVGAILFIGDFDMIIIYKGDNIRVSKEVAECEFWLFLFGFSCWWGLLV